MLRKTRIEGDVPIESLYELAMREGNSKKPVYEMHKWWARRLGSVFRLLLLLATAPEEQTDEEVWTRFYGGDDLSHLRLLDPFMGGGTSMIEAAKLRFQTAGVDIDPVAWFITRQEMSPCDVEVVEEAFARLESSEEAGRIRWLYQTTVPEQPDGRETDVIYNFWVDVLTCPNCGSTFEAHNHYKLLYHAKKPFQTVFCKVCHHTATLDASQHTLRCQHCAEVTEIERGPIERGNYTCPTCNHRGRIVDLPKPGFPLLKKWFAIEYLEPVNQRKAFKTPDAHDLERYSQAELLLASSLATLPFPRREIPLLGREDLRPTTHGYAFYSQLFNARQLLALGWLLEWISAIASPEIRDYFVLAFSDALAANNMLCSFAYGYDKLTPLFGLHAYNMITRPIENNVWGTVFGRGSFVRCLKKVIEGKRYCCFPYESRYDRTGGKLEKVFVPSPISSRLVTTGEAWYQRSQEPNCLLLNHSSESLKEIHDGTVHLILTDPPYYNNLSYSELSDFYYAWTQPFLEQAGAAWSAQTTPYNEALFVRQRTDSGQSIETFVTGLCSIFKESFRVLDDKGLFIFTYHHLDTAAWVPLAQALLDARFVVTNVFPVRSEGRSKFHSTEGTAKWDAVFVCRKGYTVPIDEYEKSPFAQLWRKDQGEEILAEILTPIVTEAARSWQKRLQARDVPFAWPDLLSLTYAFGVQGLTMIQSEDILNLDVRSVFATISASTVKCLPESAQQRMRKRKHIVSR
jgi:putative DNA methylase